MTSGRPYWCSKTMHEAAAILLFQTNPVGFGPFFLCSFVFLVPNTLYSVRGKCRVAESIRNAYFNLERLSRSIRPALPAGNFDFLIQTPNFPGTEPNE